MLPYTKMVTPSTTYILRLVQNENATRQIGLRLLLTLYILLPQWGSASPASFSLSLSNMSKRCLRAKTFFRGIFGIAVAGLYATIYYYVASFFIGVTDTQAAHLYELTHLLPNNCTIVRASLSSDEGFISWIIHVNYTVPIALDPLHSTSHLNLLHGTTANDLYTVNSTIPCFYAISNFDFVTVNNGGVDFGDVFNMGFFLIFCILFVTIPLVVGIYLFSGFLQSMGVFEALKSMGSTGCYGLVGSLRSLVSTIKNGTALQMRNRKPFSPVAQSEEEAFDLESTVDSFSIV